MSASSSNCGGSLNSQRRADGQNILERLDVTGRHACDNLTVSMIDDCFATARPGSALLKTAGRAAA